MARQTKRFQPYHGDDGDYCSLLDFALPAAQLLDPAFNPPKALISREDTEGMQDMMRFYKRWGNEQQGFETTHIVELEPRASGQAVDRVQLNTFGLLDGCSLEIECARVWYDPRFIEIKVEGPQVAVEQLIVDFELQFGGTQLDPSKIRQTLVSARVSRRVGALDAAIMKADMVLDLEPDNPEALLEKAQALAAKRETEQVVSVAKRVLEHEPGSEEARETLRKIAKSAE